MERKDFDRLQLSIDATAKQQQQQQAPAAPTASGEVNPIGTSSSTLSSSFSPPCFLKSVQAALKRHRPLGTMQSDALRARRVPVRQRQPSRPANGPVAAVTGENGPRQESDLLVADGDLGIAYNQEKGSSEDFSPTLSFGSGSSPQEFPVGEVSIAGQGPVQQQQPIKTMDVPIAAITSGNSRNQVTDPMVGCGSSDARFGQEKSTLEEISLTASSNPGCITTWLEHGVGNGIAAVSSNLVHTPHVPSQIVSFDIHHKKMQPFSVEEIGSRFQSEPKGPGENERVTMCISADGFPSHRTSIALTEREILGGIPPMKDQAPKQPVPQQTEMSEVSVKFFAAHPVAKIPGRGYDPQPEDPIIQCSTMGSTCVTTMSIHSGPPQSTGAASAARTTVPTQVLAGSAEVQDVAYINGLGAADKESDRLLEHVKAPQFDVSAGRKGVRGDASNLHPLNPRNNSSNVDMDPSKSNKGERASRKKKYDPDLFFKVNGKLYQKLGKIGSGGSSEVYKVIASDCNIFALKRIKLKGRDYPTACGFCQEIEYLNKLKGRNNIIQLVDYEVTDKTLLEEVMTGCMAMKDGRIKADSNIYMVLEFGEIDLAHMLSQKLKDSGSLTWNSKENWIRFYWQQMLEAVNMIHEERIVHSDLKPANFLLVKGSLKLIDFGIAKAILSDTTNIQRDAQVGTLNYMSPEAFMWNEQDESGSTIKCGRPSDIWSLGCILHQMVYGKTPFADYKTFWAKFKVITDRNYEIVYEPIPNPWLIDLLKKCLAWDRDERWRIPQLLQHPFLNPPFSPLE